MDRTGKDIPEGYHLRIDGATLWAWNPETRQCCDNCGRKSQRLTGMEFDYPEHPDLMVCDRCLEEWVEKRYAN